MTDHEKMARELLAQVSGPWLAEQLRAGENPTRVRLRITPILFAITAAYNKGRADMREEAAKVCHQQMQDFLLPEYAAGQPISSISERFACASCAAAIRAIPVEGE